MFSASKTAAPVSGSFQVSNSLRFRSSASAYLNRTPSVAGNRTTWTWSGWVKRGTLGVRQSLLDGYASSAGHVIEFSTSDTLEMYAWGGLSALDLNTTQVFRDPSAWYHIVVAADTTQATATNRIKLYVNGVQITSFSTATYPPQNEQLYINNNVLQDIGRRGSNQYYFDGYMAEVNFIDGQALTPSSFGSINATTGVWQPARYTGSYGTNGFYLKFNNGTSTTTLGNDSSGNGNNWTTNNISLTAGSTYDWMIDSPTSYAGSSYGVGNYAVLNPLLNSGGTISNGNLSLTSPAGSFPRALSIYVSSGVWYVEASISWDNLQNYTQFGIAQSSQIYSSGVLSQLSTSYGISATPSFSNYATFQSSTYTQWGAKPSSGTALAQIAFDASSGKIWFGINGSWLGGGDPATGTSPTYSSVPSANWFFGLNVGSDSSNTAYVNCGQRPFSYTPPSGFKSLCTQNLPAPAIYNGANHMAATTYTGTLLSNSITNSGGFQPDLVWIKSRSAATDHKLTDSVRGVTKGLISNTTGAETTDSQGVTAFGSSGFTVGTDTTYNNLSATYVGWQWKAGGTAVSNTSGTITSSVSANTTAGFSVVTYTGTGANATVGHGLNVAPSMFITKKRSSTSDWGVYHSSLTSAAYYLLLGSTAAQASGATYWNSTAPTSSVFSIGTADPTNISTATYVAYCFAAIAGYSAFGSYTGNGSADGPFVYCGFRPRFVLIKRTDSAVDWVLFDTSRNTYNVTTGQINPNTSAAEDNSYTWLDILSNGFKCRVGLLGTNASGGTYIYAAFAENPFQNSLAR